MTERNHNNKNKDPRPPEKEQAHPKHPPYKREHKDWLNLFLDEDDLMYDENEELSYREWCEKHDVPYDPTEDYWRWT